MLPFALFSSWIIYSSFEDGENIYYRICHAFGYPSSTILGFIFYLIADTAHTQD